MNQYLFKVNNKETKAMYINVVLLSLLLFRTGIHTLNWVKQILIVSLLKNIFSLELKQQVK